MTNELLSIVKKWNIFAGLFSYIQGIHTLIALWPYCRYILKNNEKKMGESNSIGGIVLANNWKWKLNGLPLVHCNIDNMVGMVWFADIMLEQQQVCILRPQQPRTDRSEYCSMELVGLAHNIRHHLSQQPPIYVE